MFHKSNYFLRNSNHTAQFALSNGDLPTKSKSDPLRRPTPHKKQKRPKSLSTRLSEKTPSRHPASPKKAKATPSWDRLSLIGSEPNYFVASLTFSAAAFTASAAFSAASTPASTFSAVSTTCSATSSTLVCSQASASSHSAQSASVHSSAASTTSTASSAAASASAAG